MTWRVSEDTTRCLQILLFFFSLSINSILSFMSWSAVPRDASLTNTRTQLWGEGKAGVLLKLPAKFLLSFATQQGTGSLGRHGCWWRWLCPLILACGHFPKYFRFLVKAPWPCHGPERRLRTRDRRGEAGRGWRESQSQELAGPGSAEERAAEDDPGGQ